jgi:cytochrome c biogenesis protein CcmG/thiol:disulfide interchange protein DsbE
MHYAGRIPGPNRFFSIVLLLCLPFALASCQDEDGGSAGKSQAPDFTLTRFDGGGGFRLSDHRGNPVIINFYASWCTTCGIEANDLEKVYQEYLAKEVMFVGVGIDDTETKARQFLAKNKITYPSGLDVTGSIKEDYGLHGLPYTFFVDRKGFITYIHAGAVTEALLKFELAKML